MLHKVLRVDEWAILTKWTVKLKLKRSNGVVLPGGVAFLGAFVVLRFPKGCTLHTEKSFAD